MIEFQEHATIIEYRTPSTACDVEIVLQFENYYWMLI